MLEQGHRRAWGVVGMGHAVSFRWGVIALCPPPPQIPGYQEGAGPRQACSAPADDGASHMGQSRPALGAAVALLGRPRPPATPWLPEGEWEGLLF